LQPHHTERLSIIFLVLLVLFLVAVIYYNQTEATSTKGIPGISISDFQIAGVQSLNSSGTTLVLQFAIKDSTPIGGTIENASYALYADGSYVGRGIVNGPVEIPARGSTVASSDFLLTAAGSFRGSRSYFLDLGAVSWRATGSAKLVQSLLGSFRVQFDCTSTSGPISCSYRLV